MPETVATAPAPDRDFREYLAEAEADLARERLVRDQQNVKRADGRWAAISAFKEDATASKAVDTVRKELNSLAANPFFRERYWKVKEHGFVRDEARDAVIYMFSFGPKHLQFAVTSYRGSTTVSMSRAGGLDGATLAPEDFDGQRLADFVASCVSDMLPDGPVADIKGSVVTDGHVTGYHLAAMDTAVPPVGSYLHGGTFSIYVTSEPMEAGQPFTIVDRHIEEVPKTGFVVFCRSRSCFDIAVARLQEAREFERREVVRFKSEARTVLDGILSAVGRVTDALYQDPAGAALLAGPTSLFSEGADCSFRSGDRRNWGRDSRTLKVGAVSFSCVYVEDGTKKWMCNVSVRDGSGTSHAVNGPSAGWYPARLAASALVEPALSGIAGFIVRQRAIPEQPSSPDSQTDGPGDADTVRAP